MVVAENGSKCYFGFSVLLILAVTATGCSQPSGFYVVPEHKDLGIITGNKRVATAKFEIFNGLSRPVEVKHIYPSCKCTKVEIVKNPIPPGESTILRATADLSQLAGKQEFSLVFITDDSEFPQATFI
jgi:hypothetical protein